MDKCAQGGLALHHPAAELLLEYAMKGCPAQTGKQWTRDELQSAIDKGPHVSALVPDAMRQLQLEVEEKVAKGQVRVVEWDDIKHNPPPELKISPIAMIPHKSRAYRAILDLSFSLRLEADKIIDSVNNTTTKTALQGAIDQMGHALTQIIHAMAEADESGTDKKVFMAKWDIKDGFWRLVCEEGQEWNFAYVLPQPSGEPIRLVIPTSLQMGWIESPPYFCAASETGRDVAQRYAETTVGSLQEHKFISYTQTGEKYQALPDEVDNNNFRYLIEVFVDDYILLAMARSKK